jgi:hypothetical protein
MLGELRVVPEFPKGSFHPNANNYIVSDGRLLQPRISVPMKPVPCPNPPPRVALNYSRALPNQTWIMAHKT